MNKEVQTLLRYFVIPETSIDQWNRKESLEIHLCIVSQTLIEVPRIHIGEGQSSINGVGETRYVQAKE